MLLGKIWASGQLKLFQCPKKPVGKGHIGSKIFIISVWTVHLQLACYEQRGLDQVISRKSQVLFYHLVILWILIAQTGGKI